MGSEEMWPELKGKSPPKAESREYADFLIEKVGLSEYKKHLPSELSGGRSKDLLIETENKKQER